MDIMDDGYADDYDDWIVAEEGNELSDTLALSSLPDAFFDDAAYEYYFYDGGEMTYWDELEYDNDEFYDPILREPRHSTTGHKRKRPSNHNADHKSKRRKSLRGFPATGTISKDSLVIWRSEVDDQEVIYPSQAPCRVHAVFPDWRTRFSTDKAWAITEGERGSERHGDRPTRRASDHMPLLALLRDKLTTMGLGAEQQSVLLESLMDTLSSGSEDNLDELLDQLTDSLLTEASDDDGGRSAQWLLERGIDLSKGNDAESVDQSELATMGKSPGDSAVEVETTIADMVQCSPTRGTRGTIDAKSCADVTNQQSGGDSSLCETNGSSFPQDGSGGEIRQVSQVRAASKRSDGSDAADRAPTKPTKTSTRKRKAAAEPEREEQAEPAAPNKRQQRNFAAPTASSSSKRIEGVASRSTRSSGRRK